MRRRLEGGLRQRCPEMPEPCLRGWGPCRGGEAGPGAGGSPAAEGLRPSSAGELSGCQPGACRRPEGGAKVSPGPGRAGAGLWGSSLRCLGQRVFLDLTKTARHVPVSR